RSHVLFTHPHPTALYTLSLHDALPIWLYMREMGRVPLLTRDQEVAIAKRIEWGQNRAQKAITRSPVAVAELLKIGDELETGHLRSEEHTSELQSRFDLVCRLLLEKKNE